MRRIAMLVAALLPCLATAQIYKWVDEKGVTQYSQTPPPNGKAEKVEPKPSTGAGRPVESDWRKRDLDSRAQKIERDQRDKEDEAKAQVAAAERRERCGRARNALVDLRTPIPIYTTNDKGERTYLEDAERAREIVQREAEVKANCD